MSTIQNTHSEGGSHVKDYILIFVGLSVLTFVEVAVTSFSMSPFMLTALLLILAFVKASMVAWYFMHLKYDAKYLAFIAGVPVFLVCIAIIIIGYEMTTYTTTAPKTDLKYITHEQSHNQNESVNQTKDESVDKNKKDQ
jgi:caa(3)-type oxidase subunit IV